MRQRRPPSGGQADKAQLYAAPKSQASWQRRVSAVVQWLPGLAYHILWSDVVLVEAGALGTTLEPIADEKPAPVKKKARPAAAVEKAARKVAKRAAKTEAKTATKKPTTKTPAKKAAAKKTTAKKTTAKKSTRKEK